MIWITVTILALMLLISRLQKARPKKIIGGAPKTGGNEVDLNAMIREANKVAGWKTLEEAVNDYGKFLGVYVRGGNIPKTTMTIDQFAQIVKKTIGTSTEDKKVIVQSIIAIAIREQGAERGLAFPDNNPFGFNAFAGKWQNIRHLINGIFLAKDRNGWRWFIGFPSLENAVKAIEISLRNKGFNKIKTPEDFVKLYVRKWWSPTKDEYELQKIIQKEMRAIISIWNRAGKYVG